VKEKKNNERNWIDIYYFYVKIPLCFFVGTSFCLLKDHFDRTFWWGFDDISIFN
jgi:hypothetical protein